MTINDLLFIPQCITVALFALAATRIGANALTAFVAVCWILGNLLVTKQVTIFGLDVIATDCFAVGSSLAITLLSDYFGKKNAQQSLIVGWLCSAFFVTMSLLHLAFVPNQFDSTQPHFYAILQYVPRIVIASATISLVSMNLNIAIFQKLGLFLPGWSFARKSMISLCVSHFVDTALFAFFALYGTVHSITNVILFSFTVKCIAVFISLPTVHLLRRFIPKEQ